MKPFIYITGITAALLLLARIFGIFLEFPFNQVLLVSGSILLGLALLLELAYKNHLDNKAKRIAQEKREHFKSEKDKPDVENTSTGTKGWGMNNSPFRERKSGLTWGGGNVKGANASRGKKRPFMKGF